jgi:hypothetical protein
MLTCQWIQSLNTIQNYSHLYIHVDHLSTAFISSSEMYIENKHGKLTIYQHHFRKTNANNHGQNEENNAPFSSMFKEIIKRYLLVK